MKVEVLEAMYMGIYTIVVDTSSTHLQLGLVLELVRAGWADALTVPPNDVYQNDFENAADAARRAGAGMWGEGWVSLR